MLSTLNRKIGAGVLFPWFASIMMVFYPLSFFKSFSSMIKTIWLEGNLLVLKLLFVDKIYLHYNPKILNKTKVLVISNHVTTLDWFILTLALFKIKHENIFFSAKKSLIFLGHFLKQFTNGLHFIFLNRNLTKDYITLTNSCMKMKLLTNYALVLFPEGTLVTRKRSPLINMQRSSKLDIPTPKNVLVPKTKGAEIIINNLGSEMNGLINCTICYSNNMGLSLRSVFSRKRISVNIYFDYEEIPSLDKTKECIYNIFKEKDKELEYGVFSLYKKHYLTTDIKPSKFGSIFFILPWLENRIKTDLVYLFKKRIDD